MSGAAQVIEAELTLRDGRFQRGVRVKVGDDGRIEMAGGLDETPTLRLPGRALLPGMVNAHSHAFQRGLRGRGESFPEGAGTFWTWREAMYGLVERMDGPTLATLSRQAFAEMLAAGITTVGEFHYLHHDAGEAGYAFDEVILEAAADAGIRLVLLNAYYRTGGIEQPLEGGQRRFGSPDLETYWAQMDRLGERLDPRLQTLGAVAHSIRAAGIDEIQALHEEARRRHMVLHMHVEEQPREIEDCLHAYGRTPMALLTAHMQLGPDFTAVHCTHTAEADLDELLESGANVCLCPLTEANLGDGLPNLPRLLRRGGHVCLGTDSNARICFLEEMRWLEYAHRLVSQTRGVCRDGSGRVAPTLWDMATAGGARALGLRAGRIEPGHLADLVAVDLSAPPLAGWTEDTLLESLVLGSGDGAVSDVCVGGAWQSVGTGP